MQSSQLRARAHAAKPMLLPCCRSRPSKLEHWALPGQPADGGKGPSSCLGSPPQNGSNVHFGSGGILSRYRAIDWHHSSCQGLMMVVGISEQQGP